MTNQSRTITEILKDLEALIDEKTVARVLGLHNHRTLAVWRSTNRYPTLGYLEIGRCVRYRVRDVLAFLERSSSSKPKSS